MYVAYARPAACPPAGAIIVYAAAAVVCAADATFIQSHWRAHRARQRFNIAKAVLERRAATCIQRVFRSYLLQRRLLFLSFLK